MMKFGLLAFMTDSTLRPSELAREAEARGYESFWVPDHTHVPVSRATPYPPGGELSPEYPRMLDPFAALMDASSTTSTIRLGTGVCIVGQRDPIILAKQCATIDYLSGGRFMLGVGYGWNVEEMRNHGVRYRDRHAITREKLVALKALWTCEVAELAGDHVTIEPSWMWPKPVQQPHPPIIIGAKGPTAYRHVAELGDGWMPTAGGVASRTSAIEAELRRADRSLASIDFTVFAPRVQREAVEHYVELGVDRLVLAMPTTEARHASEVLDHFDEVIAPFTGRTAV